MASSPSLGHQYPSRAFLFQHPRRWTPQNLVDLKVVQRFISATDLPEDLYLPREEGIEFGALVHEFAQPTKRELEAYEWHRCTYRHNPFQPIFLRLQEAAGVTDYIDASKLVLLNLFDVLLSTPNMSGLLVSKTTKIPLTIQPSGIQCAIKCAGAIYKVDSDYNPPLATFLVRNSHEDRYASVQAYEVILHILGQGFIAYSQNPTKDSYTAFVFCIERTTLRLSTATIPRTYIEELYNGAVLSRDLIISHSEPYDLLEPCQRKEVLRLVISICRGFRVSRNVHS